MKFQDLSAIITYLGSFFGGITILIVLTVAARIVLTTIRAKRGYGLLYRNVKLASSTICLIAALAYAANGVKQLFASLSHSGALPWVLAALTITLYVLLVDAGYAHHKVVLPIIGAVIAILAAHLIFREPGVTLSAIFIFGIISFAFATVISSTKPKERRKSFLQALKARIHVTIVFITGYISGEQRFADSPPESTVINPSTNCPKIR